MENEKISEVLFTSVKINDEYWSRRLDISRKVTLPVCIKKCEETGRISNFAKAAGTIKGEFEGIYFNDSDVYKVIEGIAYSLMSYRDEELEDKADYIIDLISKAQLKDGYLDTYFTISEPDKKWTDMEKHEDYCAGHLFEAAVAYKKATGKGKLLEVACKLADHMISVLGPDKKHWVVGHEEPELALIKLYKETGETKYLEFSKWLLEERGHGYGSGAIWDKNEWSARYCQDDKPIRDLSEVSGHAVRAMFLYTAMADIALLNGDTAIIRALDKLWDSVIIRNMYITGGIGSTKDNEGFTEDYDLPNDTAYCETCAAIGMVFWNHRMNLLKGDTKYADVIEKELYNGVMSGISLSGDKFFYVNPLCTDGSHHRQEWYGCSCCPTQLARFIPSVGGYAYSISGDSIYVNQYLSSESNLNLDQNKIIIKQRTNYPWDGTVKLVVEPEIERNFYVKLRIPKWCENLNVSINGEKIINASIKKGYLIINRLWSFGDEIELVMDMPVKIMHENTKVKADIGLACVQKGPIIYCFEETDNKDCYDNISISNESTFKTNYQSELLDGVNVIKVISIKGETFTAVPYYAWDNREAGSMKVWVKYNENVTQI